MKSLLQTLSKSETIFRQPFKSSKKGIAFRFKYGIFFLLLFSSLIFTQAQISQKQLVALDQYIEHARRQWEAPGLSVAIVKDGEIVLKKGYGERALGSGDKVNTQTIFAAASTTKAMTAVAMGILVDEGKVTWDDRVIEHMPEFQLYDPYVTRELKVRDLFTHNAGLGNADALWGLWDYSSEEILYKMRQLKPAYSFRGGYTYQNIMYAAAGALIEKLSGKSWADFVQTRVFQPLGMNNSFPTLERSQVQKNRSTPHHYIDGKISPIPDASADRIGAAGSAWSCADDVAKWMSFILDSARIDGKPLLKPETFAELLKPHAIIPQESFYPTVQLTKPHWTTYALGWFQHDYKGRFVSFHTGSLQGTVAIIGLIPDEKLGVYVYGNLDHAEVRHAIMYKVFDVFGGDYSGRDWSTDFLKLYTNLREQGEQRAEEVRSKRIANTKPRFSIADYAGVYEDPYLGKLILEVKNDVLQVSFDGYTDANLVHWHNETFAIKWHEKWVSDSYLNFDQDLSGNILIEFGGRTFKKHKND